MTNKEKEKLVRQKEQEELEFIQYIEANKTGNWCCGIKAIEGYPDKIWGLADTELDAKKYMKIKLDWNGGFYPVRLTVEQLGWWFEPIFRSGEIGGTSKD